MKHTLLTAVPVLLSLSVLGTACGSPGGKTPAAADTVPGNKTVTGAEESSASDTTRKDGTIEEQPETTVPGATEPAGRGTEQEEDR
jgi:hypothetical protein